MKILHKLILGSTVVASLIGLAGHFSFHLSDQVMLLRSVVLPMEQTLHELDAELWEAGHEEDNFDPAHSMQSDCNFASHASAVDKALAQFRARLIQLRVDPTMCLQFGEAWAHGQLSARDLCRTSQEQFAAQQALLGRLRSLRAAMQPGLESFAKTMSAADAAPQVYARIALDSRLEQLAGDATARTQSSSPNAAAETSLELIENDIASINDLWLSTKGLVFAHDDEATTRWEGSWGEAAAVAGEIVKLQRKGSELAQSTQSALHTADSIIDTQMRPCVQRQIDLAQTSADHDRRYAAASAIVCVIVSLSVCGLVAYNIVGGLSHSIALVKRLAAGDLQSRCSAGPRDEFRSLADALNWTASTLARNEENLRREITARGRLLESLQQSEQRFGQIAESISEVFWILSVDGREIQYVSPAYEAVSGLTCASLYADPASWNECILAEDAPRRDLALARAGQGEHSEVEYRFVNLRSQQTRWIRSRFFPLLGKDKRIDRVCGVSEDVTERKLTETASEELNKRLRDLSHEAGRAEVATNVLHNVGNVLNSVNVAIEVATRTAAGIKINGLQKVAALLTGHSDDLAGFLSQDPQGQRLPLFLAQLAQHFEKERTALLAELRGVRGHVEHINEIVAMQQNYATSGGLIETLPVHDVIEDALRMNTAALERHGAYVVREFAPALPLVPLDRHKVLQILINLIRNAKYAMDEGGAADKRLTLRTELSGDKWVQISVIDTGIGIAAENLPRIFEHGFTTRKEGHGFGLHSSVLAAKELGGLIEVHSAGAGQGTRFSLSLPTTA